MMDGVVEAAVRVPESPATSRIEGVVIGMLVGFGAAGEPIVAFPGNREPAGVPSRSTAVLGSEDVGCELALLFEEGDPARPLIMGRLHRPNAPCPQPDTPVAEIDGERLELQARKEIVLRCGRASITLTRAGKIIIRGAYLLSRSSGVNRIKGGSVQIN